MVERPDSSTSQKKNNNNNNNKNDQDRFNGHLQFLHRRLLFIMQGQYQVRRSIVCADGEDFHDSYANIFTADEFCLV